LANANLRYCTGMSHRQTRNGGEGRTSLQTAQDSLSEQMNETRDNLRVTPLDVVQHLVRDLGQLRVSEHVQTTK
jgi:hypothetical protein